jgi:hypothetical protein
MYTGNDFTLGVLIPFLVGVTVMAAGALLDGRRRWRWPAPLAIAAAFMVGFPLIANAAPSMPPAAAGDWLFWLALPLAVVAMVDATRRFPAPARLAIAFVALAGALLLMLRPATRSGAIEHPLLVSAALAATLTIDWWFAERAVHDDRTATSFVGLLCILAGACGLVLLSDSQKYAAQAGAAVAGGAAAWAVARARTGSRHERMGGAPLTLVALAGSMFAISLETVLVNVKLHNALLIASAPPLLWASTFIRQPRRPWLAAVVRLSLPAAPVLIALVLAGFKAYQDLHGGGDPGGGGYDPWE